MTRTDEEVRRTLALANDVARLAGQRVVPDADKLRRFGASEALIQELCK